jgi:hypothetical protein
MSKKKESEWDGEVELLDSHYSVGAGKPPVDLGGDSREEVLETIPDMAVAARKGATLSHYDDISEYFSEGSGQKVRDREALGMERSPIASTVAEIGTPDVIDLATMGAGKVRKLGKLGELIGGAGDKIRNSNIRTSVATDALAQKGETSWDEDLNMARTSQAGIVGAIGKAVKGITPDSETMRKSYLGLDPEAMARRSSVLGADDYGTELISKMDTSGLFKKGLVDFNPKTLSWERKGSLGKNISDKAKSSVVPPSQKEIYGRIEDAKKKVAEGIQDITRRESATPMMDFMEDFPIQSERAGVIDVNNLKNHVEDIVNNVSVTSEAEREGLRKVLNFKIGEVAEEGGEIPLIKLHELRSELDQMIKYDRKAGVSVPSKEQALKQMADTLRGEVKNALSNSGDARFAELNETYSNLADISTGLRDKVLKPKSAYGKAGLLSGNLGYKAATAAEIIGDPVLGVMGQARSTMEKLPDIGGFDRGVRKLNPAMSPDREPNTREPQSVMSPQERLEMNIPKQLMNTKLPRTSEGVVANKKIFKLKIAQEAEDIIRARAELAGIDSGIIPREEVAQAARELYLNMSMILDEKPEDVGKKLASWTTQFPHMFEEDPYNRVDGVVPQSLQPKLREDIRKDEGIGNTERIKRLNILNKTGKYLD